MTGIPLYMIRFFADLTSLNDAMILHCILIGINGIEIMQISGFESL